MKKGSLFYGVISHHVQRGMLNITGIKRSILKPKNVGPPLDFELLFISTIRVMWTIVHKESSRLDTDLMLTSQPNSAERESESEGKGGKKS
jgi:hypothetical protein